MKMPSIETRQQCNRCMDACYYCSMQEIERVSLILSKRNPLATHTLSELSLSQDPM